MKPLLAHVYEPHRITYPCYVQPKLNGIRALYQAGRFQSRDELPFPQGLLDHLAGPLRQLFGPDVILDGELYKHGWPLQRINAAVTPVRQRPTEDTLQVEYHVFDVIDFSKSFEDRAIEKYNYLAPQQIPICPVSTFQALSEGHADFYYCEFVSANYEGMMYRLGDCPYTVPKQPRGTFGLSRSPYLSDKNNRTWHLLKRKDWHDDEFLCEAAFEGEGKNRGMLGSFGCVTPSGKPFTVGSGLTDAERIFWWENSPRGKRIKVKYLVLSSDGIPLNPTVLAVL